MDDAIQTVLILGSIFGGVSLIISTSMKAKIARMRAEREMWQPPQAAAQSDAVLTELKAMQQQIAQMQSTSHQFDISFDAALSRLEGRVDRLETKTAAGTVTGTDTPASLRNGHSPQ